MKKIFAIAMLFAAVSMVSCGGQNGKKAEDKCCEKSECCEKAEGECCGCCEGAEEEAGCEESTEQAAE